MREQRTIVDGIEFGKVFQFYHILASMASSMQPTRLLIGLGMVLILFASGRVWDSVSGVDASALRYTTTIEELHQKRSLAIAQAATAMGHKAPADSVDWSVQEAQLHLVQVWRDFLFEGSASVTEQAEFESIYVSLEQVRPRGPFESSALFIADAWSTIVDAGLHLNPSSMWQGVVAIVWELPQRLWQGGFHWFISIYGFLLIYVMCIGGGAIARMQACWHARSQRMSVQAAIGYSTSKWRQLLTAIISPAMFVAAIAIVLMMIGLLLFNIPGLNLIGGLLYGFSLLLGFVVAIAAVGYAASCLLLIPAIVVENCSGGEAVQRSYAYLFSKTLHMIGYLVVLIIALILGFVVVRLIANLTLDLTANLVSSWTFNMSLHGAGSLQVVPVPNVNLALHETTTSWMVGVWETVVYDLMIGWVFSGFFSASTMVYLLMRNTCDGQETRDIWWEGMIEGTNIPNNH